MGKVRFLAGARARQSAVVAALSVVLVAVAGLPAQAKAIGDPAGSRTSYKIVPYVISDPDLVKHSDKVAAELTKSGNLDSLGITPATAKGPSTIAGRKHAAEDQPASYVVDSSRFPGGQKPADPYQYADAAECAAHSDLAAQDAGWIKNRYSYCQLHLIAATAVRCTFFPVRCQVTGVFISQDMLLGYGKIGGYENDVTSRWADFQLHVQVLLATGPFNGSRAHLTTSIECDGNYLDPDYPQTDANACFGGLHDQVEKSIPEWAGDGNAHLDLKSQASTPDPSMGEQLGTGVFHIKYSFDLPFPYIFGIDASGPDGGMRFDSAWYLTLNKAEQLGSVFDRAVPGFAYSLRDQAVRGVTDHLLQALADPPHTVPLKPNKTLPGIGPSDPIRRLPRAKSTDLRARARANRTTATNFCRNNPDMPPQPPTGGPFDCDEYPMASTYEGAARAQYEGPQYDLDYSVRWVNRDQNQEAGRRQGAWYVNDRLIDGDKFFIPILP